MSVKLVVNNRPMKDAAPLPEEWAVRALQNQVNLMAWWINFWRGKH